MDDEMVQMRRQQQNKIYCKKIGRVFQQLDTTGDGILSRKELEQLMTNKSMHTMLHTLEIDTHDLGELFDVLDDGDGEIAFKEFTDGMSRMRGPATNITLLKMLGKVDRISDQFNRMFDQSGTVSRRTERQNDNSDE
eukprot:gnl/TRDRNA2_/TRDRNA2_158505_c1_seq1.p1 gnl/TRDRNA2_/TRDRNA2_158505_c1~~gnl/TRDRNA2_/TRDRNA2_158505_c1_seq1.p1  ORF type:complete len:148 (+),score=29.11 gnl/TRDRNA2_/TRDRNA2_158505_c1_seq1:34-444(+)